MALKVQVGQSELKYSIWDLDLFPRPQYIDFSSVTHFVIPPLKMNPL